MEDQGKRMAIAVAAAIGIYFLWTTVFPPSKEEPSKTGSGSAALVSPSSTNPIGKPSTPEAGPGSGSGAAGIAGAAPSTSTDHPRNAADEIALDDLPRVHAVFSKWGGTLVSWQLKDERFATTTEHGELIASEPGATPKDPAVQRGAFDVNFADSSLALPAGAAWSGFRKGNVVTYTLEDDKLVVTKRYTVYADDFLIKLEIDVQAKKAPADPQPVYDQHLAVSVFGYQDAKGVQKAGRTTRQWSATCLANGSVQHKPLVNLASEWPSSSDGGPTVTWAGVDHPYFLLAMAPVGEGNNNLSCRAFPGERKGEAQVAVLFEPDHIRGGDTAHHVLWAYAGAKLIDKLDHADDVVGTKVSFDRSVSFGWSSFRFIALPLLWLLQQFYGLVGNWGLAIILLTIVVKLATLYWTTKSMRSMRAMASMKPKIDELQKKFGNDRARLQQETMAMYKANGINPLAGCLPMLLQMPIWMALYGMLSAVGELYNAPFIKGWINDLTAQDPYYILGIALVLMMFVQAKLQPKTGDGTQQKIMMYALPGVFGVMSLFFPSGLTLYILTNTILTSIHSVYMRKWDKSAKLAVPAAAAVPAGSKRDDAPATKAKPVIDAESVERAESNDDDDDGADDDDGDDEASQPAQKTAAKTQPKNKNANRPRRGQRRGGRN